MVSVVQEEEERTICGTVALAAGQLSSLRFYLSLSLSLSSLAWTIGQAVTGRGEEGVVWLTEPFFSANYRLSQKHSFPDKLFLDTLTHLSLFQQLKVVLRFCGLSVRNRSNVVDVRLNSNGLTRSRRSQTEKKKENLRTICICFLSCETFSSLKKKVLRHDEKG